MFTMTEDSIIFDSGPVKILSLSGYLDASNLQQFEQKVNQLLTLQPLKVIISLQGLEYISSAGIGLLLSVDRAMKKTGGKLVLADVPAKIARIFDVLGFSKILTITKNLETAASVLGVGSSRGN